MRLLRMISPGLLAWLSVAGAFLPPAHAEAAYPGNRLTGTIVDANGDRQAALVTVKNRSRGIAWTLLSDPSGHFRLENIPSGSYLVSIRHPGYAHTGVEIEEFRGTRHLDIRLSDPQPGIPLSNADMLHYLPEAGQARQLLRFHCIQCHGLELIVHQRKSPQQWKQTVDAMARRVPTAPAGQMQAITEYLSRHFGQTGRIDIPVTRSPDYRFEPGAVMMELDLPGDSLYPHEIVLGPEGNLWVSDFNVRPDPGHNAIFRIDPKTLAVRKYELSVAATGSRSIAFDRDGTPWVTVLFGDVLARLDPVSGTAEAVKLPRDNIWPHSMIFDRNDRVWFTGMMADVIGSYDRETGEVKFYPVPTRHSMLYDINVDEAGNLWYTGLFAHKLGRFEPETGAFTEFQTPTPLSSTRYLTFGADGSVWVALFAAGKIGHFNPADNSFSEISLPDPNSSPYDLLVTDDNKIWFTDFTRNSVNRMDPESGTFHEFSIVSSPYARPTELAITPDGKVWFCENATGKIGFVDPDGLRSPGVYVHR